VCLFQGTGKGTVFHSKKRGGPEPTQPASRKRRRTCLTHVAIICDNPRLQPLLPQYIIGNHNTFLQRDWSGLLAGAPGNVVLVRQQSAWNNIKLFVQILQRLGTILRPYLVSCQPVVFFDASPLHCAKAIFQACLKSHLWVVLVPARLTWLLQPCDTHAFQRYKLILRNIYQAKRARSEGGELSTSEFLECMYAAIRVVLQGGRWNVAFDRDGFGQSQAELSTYVREQLQLEAGFVASASRPSEGQLRLCFPQRAKVHVPSVLPVVPATSAPPSRPVGIRLFPRVPVGSTSAPGVGARLQGRRPVAASARPETVRDRSPRTRSEHRAMQRVARGQPFTDE